MKMSIRHKAMAAIVILSTLGTGCTAAKKVDTTSLEQTGGVSSAQDNAIIPPVQIREFILSPGDEISISVLGQAELNRKVIIPPDGGFFFPIVGDIDVRSKTLRQLRQTITDGLSRYSDFTISPGDEISITVYRNDELNRRLIIPPNNRFFYPLVGEIDLKDKTISEVREHITTKLSQFVVDPQVSVDIVAYSRPKIFIEPQVSIEVVALGGQKIFVLGEVNRPGVFTAGNGTDVVEAVSRAGGFTLDARKDNILLIRGGIENPELTLLNIDKFLKGADLTQNMQLQRGDIVYVPPSIIANVDRFFKHFATIINPIVTLETGIALEPAVEGVFNGTTNGGGSSIIVPPR